MCGTPERVRFSLYSRSLYVFTSCLGVLYLCGRAVWVLARERPARPLPCLLADYRAFLCPERVFMSLPILVFMPLFMSAFTSAKSLIPVVQPFVWDATFARWDEVLHGVHPWRLLRPIFGDPFITCAVNWVYNMWFMVMFAVVFWQMFSMRDKGLRMQFFLTFVVAWIVLGTIGGMAFSSAGPCFYDQFVEGPNPYAPLMEHLRQANTRYPIWALEAQAQLWQSYANAETAIVTGISAMPSMHISMAFLFVLVAWRRSRVAGTLFMLFLAVIFIGCVHLAWHYAVDAYVAIAGTWLLWWLVGRLQDHYRTVGPIVRARASRDLQAH